MKRTTSAFALSVAGLVAVGAFAASSPASLVSLSANAAVDSQREYDRLAGNQTASVSPIGYYAIRTH